MPKATLKARWCHSPAQHSKAQNDGYSAFSFLLRTSLNKALKQRSSPSAASHCIFWFPRTIPPPHTHTPIALGPVCCFYVVLNGCQGEHNLSFSRWDLYLILSLSLSWLWLCELSICTNRTGLLLSQDQASLSGRRPEGPRKWLTHKTPYVAHPGRLLELAA